MSSNPLFSQSSVDLLNAMSKAYYGETVESLKKELAEKDNALAEKDNALAEKDKKAEAKVLAEKISRIRSLYINNIVSDYEKLATTFEVDVAFIKSILEDK